MIQDIVKTFLAADTVERLEIASREEHRAPLSAYLGTQAYAEYRALSARLDTKHLGIHAPKNLIFIPGICGSHLHSKTLAGTWWLDVRTRHHINDLRLSPDGQTDANPDFQIEPTTIDTTYEPFLAAILPRDDFGHEFHAYDWRKSLRLSAHGLRHKINCLHQENGGLPVHLAAHSMGGLLVRTTLMLHGQELWPKIGRIVFIGTPHYGSPAIASYLKNHLWGFELMALLGRYLSRDTFRSLRGALNLLPAPRGIYPDTQSDDPQPWTAEYSHPCVNFDLYQVESWKLDLTPTQSAYLQAALNDTAALHRELYAAHRALDQTQRDHMLVIAGVGYKTLFRLAYEKNFFGLWERAAKLTERIPADPHRDGDGRVPLASATLENVPIRYVRGVHGGLTNIPAVYNEVFRWLREERLQLPDQVYGALGQHLALGEGESDAPHLDGTASIEPFSDDPGLWKTDTQQPQELHLLEEKLGAEQLPEFNHIHLL